MNHDPMGVLRQERHLLTREDERARYGPRPGRRRGRTPWRAR